MPRFLPSHHPALLIATWFGAGLSPRAPGTVGSLAALPLAWLLAVLGGGTVLGLACLVCFVVGWWASDVYVRTTGGEDPSEVVVDEVAGQWLALVLAPPEPLYYLAGFLLFRLFDITKPGPVGWADRNLHGGLGVMMDDMIAGAMALGVLELGRWWLS